MTPPFAAGAAAGLAQARAPRVVAIASGKGGVGKTWLAISLAHALAARGRRVLLFDGDFGLANVDIQLGLTPARDLSAVLSGRARIGDVIVRYTPPDAPGLAFDVLPGRSGGGSLAKLELALLDRLLVALRRQDAYDVILLDLGAGIDPANRFLAAAADTLMVVSTEEPTALTDAYAVLKLRARDQAARPGVPDVRVVMNQSTSLTSGRRSFEVLSKACGNFLGREPHLAGVIRRDSKVPDSIRRQTTLLTRHPTAPVAEDLRRVAAALDA